MTVAIVVILVICSFLGNHLGPDLRDPIDGNVRVKALVWLLGLGAFLGCFASVIVGIAIGDFLNLLAAGLIGLCSISLGAFVAYMRTR